MRTLSARQMPDGFELEVPTFGYWVKAGMAFTLGAGTVTVIAGALWMFVGYNVMLRAFMR